MDVGELESGVVAHPFSCDEVQDAILLTVSLRSHTTHMTSALGKEATKSRLREQNEHQHIPVHDREGGGSKHPKSCRHHYKYCTLEFLICAFALCRVSA